MRSSREKGKYQEEDKIIDGLRVGLISCLQIFHDFSLEIGGVIMKHKPILKEEIEGLLERGSYPVYSIDANWCITHILESIKRMQEYISDMDLSAFCKDLKTQVMFSDNLRL